MGGYNTPEVFDALKQNGIRVSKIFSGNQQLIELYSLHHISELKGKSNKYFIIVPTKVNFENVILTLEKFRYKNRKDFCTFYPCIYGKTAVPSTIKGPLDFYDDDYGNHLENVPNNVSITLEGAGNNVIFGESCLVSDKLRILLHTSFNSLSIGNGTVFREDNNTIHFNFGSGIVTIGDSVRLINIKIKIDSNTLLSIGGHSIYEEGAFFALSDKSMISIGEDCLFSTDVICQAADSHTIFDVESGKNINSAKENAIDGYIKRIVIDNHVWVGRRAMILGNTHIHQGSVVGAQSVVKGAFPNNCVIAGTPARVKKKNIAWSKQNMADDIESCNGYADMTVE